MSAPHVYELHGLHVRSELPLDGRVSDSFGDPDWDVRFFDPTGEARAARNGSVLAQVDEIEYTLIATGQGEYLVRFGRDFEFQISCDRRMIEARVYPGGDPELALILLAGNVLSSVLTLQGECVLHASGIQIDGSALAIVGASGMGKSTMTALLCAAGARLISDDVLRLESSTEGTECFAGTSLIRLRPAAAELALLFPAETTTETSDGRVAIRAQQAAGSRFRLDAIVIPRPSREASELLVERLGGGAALVELLRYPRALGWQVAEPTRRAFEFLAEVATNVPMYSAEIPWGPPFDSALPSQLLARVGIGATTPVTGTR
jgi:hypothetical protein